MFSGFLGPGNQGNSSEGELQGPVAADEQEIWFALGALTRLF